MESYNRWSFVIIFIHLERCFWGSSCWNIYQYFIFLLLKKLHYTNTCILFSHSSLDGYLSVSTFWLSRISLLCIFTSKFLRTYTFHSFECTSRSGMVGSHKNFMFSILENCRVVFQGGFTILYSHQQCVRFWFLHTLTNTLFSIFF